MPFFHFSFGNFDHQFLPPGIVPDVSRKFLFLQMLGKPLQMMAVARVGLIAVRALAGSALAISNISSNLWELINPCLRAPARLLVTGLHSTGLALLADSPRPTRG